MKFFAIAAYIFVLIKILQKVFGVVNRWVKKKSIKKYHNIHSLEKFPKHSKFLDEFSILRNYQFLKINFINYNSLVKVQCDLFLLKRILLRKLTLLRKTLTC